MKTTIKIFALLALTALLLNSCSKKETEILKKYKVEFSPVKDKGGIHPPSPGIELDDKSYVIAKIDGKEIKSGDEVEEGKEIVFTAYVGTLSKFKFERWEVTGADTPSGAPLSITVKVKGALKVVGVFKLKKP